MAWYSVGNSSTTTSTGNYTIRWNYGNGYYTSNVSGNYRPKGIQDYKNKEVKQLLSKDRGW